MNTPSSSIVTAADRDAITALIRQVALEEMLPRFRHVGFAHKPDASLVTDADLAVHRRLGTELARRCPAVRFLSEEMTPAEQLALLEGSGGALWCLDPLDGTSNFVAGIPFFAVSLALLEGGRVVWGVIYDPNRDECFVAERGGGATLNGVPLSRVAFGLGFEESIAMVDLKRLPHVLRRAVTDVPPFASQRYFGAGALEWAWLAAGRGQLYLHGGQKLWDYAAGQLILAEAGGFSTTLDGEDVFRPVASARSVVAALDQGLFERWMAWVQRNRGDVLAP